ncbi:MAG TPA: SbcC/MukB-like Walker B domain-containing protein, partial [Spirochaetales bacterium]|nr:SbcC/MukB-like Walker B domain-containing protein [Spirochaetales bacterium]
ANDGNAHVGVSWKVRLMGCRFLSAAGGGSTSDAMTCIDYAVAHGAQAINASWGGYGFSQALFDSIVHADLDSAELRSICDYRTYFSYDIRIRDTQSMDPATGKAIDLSLSRVLREKSGGEAQTPYYVAIAASFYRFFKDKPDDSIRFVLFDEAFDKLDDERMRKVIDFYAQMGIQLMVAVPPGKIEAIAPLSDQICVVSRVGQDARVRDFRSIAGGNA